MNNPSREHGVAAEGKVSAVERQVRIKTMAENANLYVEDLVFIGFNSRVAALDRRSGELIWQWKSPQGSGYVAVLVDGDRLLASVMGYVYCLNPITGDVLWENPLKGLGVGVSCIATLRGSTDAGLLMTAQQAAQQAAAAS